MAPDRRPRRRGGSTTRRARSLAKIRAASLTRLRIGFLLIAMVTSVFAARLFQLQGLDAQQYAAQARAVGAVQELLPATRGSITDRNGVPLAESLDGLMIVADPTKTAPDAAEIATLLADRLGLDYIDTVRNLTWPRTRFRYVARRVPSTEAIRVVEELDRRGLKGIDTRRDPVRRYPSGDVGANVVGFMNAEGHAAEGAELLFDRLLRGKDGSATYDVGGGNRIPLGDNSTVEPRDGQDLALTLDRDVQWYAQRVLRQTIEDVRADSGSVVVMDRASGELLALADHPTFDPNVPHRRDDGVLGSQAIRQVYEPGSVQKVLTIAGLVDAGLVTPRTRLVIPPRILSSGGKHINDYFTHGTLRYTLGGVIARSSNIGTVLAAREMGSRRFHGYLRAFGLGRRTGLEGYGESAGLLAPWQDWTQLTRDTIAFGQGVAVTAVQMTAAVNAIANGGTWVQPSLVKGRASTAYGLTLGSDVAERRQVVSPHAARQVAEMMEMVTDGDTGTAPMAGIRGYRVAGKTGTAQVAVDGEYSTTDFTVSFAGFAPADDPRFTIYVVVHKPGNGGGGGGTAGPVFRKVMTYLLQKYAVPPTGTKPPGLPVEWEPGPGQADSRPDRGPARGLANQGAGGGRGAAGRQLFP